MCRIVDGFVGIQCQCVQDVNQIIGGVGVQRQQAALFDERTGQGIGEGATGENGLDGFAASGLFEIVGRNERQPYGCTGPWMFCEIARRAGGPIVCRSSWQGQWQLWRLVKRACVRAGLLIENDLAMGRFQAIVIGGMIGDGPCAVGGPRQACIALCKPDGRCEVIGDVNRPGGDRFIPSANNQGSGLGQDRFEVPRPRWTCAGSAFGWNVGVIKGDDLVTDPARQPDARKRSFRHGEVRLVGIDVRGQEDRRQSGIGRRSNPRIHADGIGIEHRMTACNVPDRTTRGSKGKCKGCQGKERRESAQGPRVAFHNGRPGSNAADIAMARGHSPLVLMPKGFGDWIGIRRDRIVL